MFNVFTKFVVLLLIISSLVVLGGCLGGEDPFAKHLKEGQFTITDQNGSPVADATAKITITTEKGNPDGTHTFTSNSNGVVEYKFYAEEKGNYRIDVSKEGCTDPSWQVYIRPVDADDLSMYCSE